MKRIYFISALLLSLTWALGFFVFNAGIFIHCVLVIGVVLYLQSVISAPAVKS